jgi:hypothetical protein
MTGSENENKKERKQMQFFMKLVYASIDGIKDCIHAHK